MSANSDVSSNKNMIQHASCRVRAAGVANAVMFALGTERFLAFEAGSKQMLMQAYFILAWQLQAPGPTNHSAWGSLKLFGDNPDWYLHKP
ncbi:MAG TPA: hypothetical protein DD656_06075 [Alphaproteobacteria bacterium]|nr:hypothetical protein [Alphaproteobacteria bacterium]